ncbi:transcription factor Tfb2 [Cryphonectria parasitica EP155]|uniref:RNA polymerase II transcription factor B subunit 2 n=1 Tax=Cryphonectria parasitica (strain ATCC 38755 / EP155) TaxID=660469 RepID=A0A9P4XVH8_CRYP1|nr:transcription factor Tfb2 [Cryphonectria parasitica EP155]KAF3761678.1 transcription factor Tfb2 [Cryphonectria parasitica EP155]
MTTRTPSLTLSDYLEKLPGTTYRRLYQQPSTTFAIFRRMLPNLAKTMVMALLYMPDPLPLDHIETWVKPEAKRARDQALGILRRLHIIGISSAGKEKSRQFLSLTTNFRASMRLALEGGGDHQSFGVPSSEPVPAHLDIAFLDRVARKKWEDILHYVVNSVELGGAGSMGGKGAGPNSSVKELLVAGRLVERTEMGGVRITQAGFTFLLQEANAQVWTLLLQWLDAADIATEMHERGQKTTRGHGLDSVDMLSFLFMLASLELGHAYDTAALTEMRRNMLPDLMDFGLVFVDSAHAGQYYPTRLATTLTSGAGALRSVSAGVDAAIASNADGVADSGQKTGFIILETNYRIYAYTSSPLQISVLALFCELKHRFAGMVTGRLTRRSIRSAVAYGITADQIISYLATHAHDQMHRMAALNNKPVLPPTVVDQIRLWQLENERMKTSKGFLFKEFDTPQEYESVARYAEEIGVLVWKSDVKQSFFASRHEQLRDFLKQLKNRRDI